jgi:hypothetical protein
MTNLQNVEVESLQPVLFSKIWYSLGLLLLNAPM